MATERENGSTATLTFTDPRRLRRLMRHAERITRAGEHNRMAALHIDIAGDERRELEITASNGESRLVHCTAAADGGAVPSGPRHYSMPTELAKAIARWPHASLSLGFDDERITLRRTPGGGKADSVFSSTGKVPESTYRRALERLRAETETPVWRLELDHSAARAGVAKLRSIKSLERGTPGIGGHVRVRAGDDGIEIEPAPATATNDTGKKPVVRLIDLLHALDDIDRGETAEIMLCETAYRLRIAIAGDRRETWLRTTHCP